MQNIIKLYRFHLLQNQVDTEGHFVRTQLTRAHLAYNIFFAEQ